MLRCVGFRGSIAAGRLGAARRYNSTNSNNEDRDATLNASSSNNVSLNEVESTPSLFATGTSSETRELAWEAVDQFMLDYGLAQARQERISRTPEPAVEDLPVKFPSFKRISNAKSKSINGVALEVKAHHASFSPVRHIHLEPQGEITTTSVRYPSFKRFQPAGILESQPEAESSPQFAPFKRIHLSNQEANSLQPETRNPPSYADYVTPSHLPTSPLLDPSFKAARSKHHLPKAQPVLAALTPFQMQLRNNPYALALATPIRVCNVTRVTLPKFFMQDYNLLLHPDSEKGEGVWWMPSGLMKKGVMETKECGENDVNGRSAEEKGTHHDQTEANTESKEGMGVTEEMPHSSSKPNNRLLGPTVHTLLRKEFLYALSNKIKTGYNTSFEKSFIDSQLLNSPRSRNLFNKARWRNDIDEFLLELMRRRVEDELCFLLKRQKGYIVGCKSWEDALAKPQIGAYLWTGYEEDLPPPEFATLDIGMSKKHKVPCHNLKFLLGREKLQVLRKKFGNRIFENTLLALRQRRATVDLQMRLWKLQGYLAEYRDISELSEE